MVPPEFFGLTEITSLMRVVVWMNDSGDMGVWNTSLNVPPGANLQSTMVGAIELLRVQDRFVVLEPPTEDGSLQYDLDEEHLSYQAAGGVIDPTNWPEVTFDELMTAAWREFYANDPECPIYLVDEA